MQITLSFDSFTELPYTSGTVQNISSQATVEICQDDTANTGLILGPGEWFSWSNSTVYARSAWDYEPVARCAVVPFLKQGEGGGSEYILPIATKNILGGVKSSDEAGAIKVDSFGKMTYNAPSSTPLSAPDWETNTAYPENALVEYNDNIYICLTAHTSGTFADDLANGKWKLVSMTLTAATSSELGGVKSNSADGGVTVDSDGKMTINLPKATSSTLGGVKIGDGLSITADGTLSATGGGTSIDEWTAGNTYAVGDFVTYQNLLYKCTTANSDSTWNPANWQKIGDANFTGATTSANGANGLVPQPTTSDISKFLCGDGTWKSAGGSGLNVIDDTLWSGTFNSVTAGDTLTLQNDYADYDEIILYMSGQYAKSLITSLGNAMGEDSDGGVLGANFSSHVIINFSGNSCNVVIWQYGTSIASNEVRLVGRKYINPNNYSTTEQEIGTWIDGKKLYQKTFTYNFIVGSGSQLLTISTLTDVDKVVEIFGCTDNGVPINASEQSTFVFSITCWFDSISKDLCITHHNDGGDTAYITIKYTKA